MEKRHIIEKSRIQSKEVPDAIFCKICKEILEDPVECSVCSSGFCKICINQWLLKHPTCPNNCVDSKIRKAHILVRNLLDQIQLTCAFAKNGCQKILAYEFIKKHEEECEFKVLPCKFEKNGCSEKFLKKNLAEHEKNCGFDQIICDKGCSEVILRKDIMSHSCITTLKNKIFENRQKVSMLSEEAKKLECEMYKANYKNTGVGCDHCKEVGFEGISYRCKVCEDFDLCAACFKISRHEHEMQKIFPIAIYTDILEIHVSELNETKKRIDVAVLAHNYDNEKRTVRYVIYQKKFITFLINDYFEIEPRNQAKNVFSFAMDKNSSIKELEFLVQELNYERYFGLPFKVVLKN